MQIIPKSLFFGNPHITNAKISPDGQWISFLKPHHGIMNLWIKPLDAAFGDAIPLTANERPLQSYFWTKDSQFLLFTKDENGDENFNIYGVRPTTSLEAVKVNAITKQPKVRTQIYQVSSKDPNILFLGLNQRDAAWHDLYRLDIQDGKLELIQENHNRITNWHFDWEDQLRMVSLVTESGNTEIHVVEQGFSLKKSFEVGLNETIDLLEWTADNSRPYVLTNTGKANLISLYLYDLERQHLELIFEDPDQKVDLAFVSFDTPTRSLSTAVWMSDRLHRHVFHEASKEVIDHLESLYPDADLHLLGHTLDRSKWIVSYSRPELVGDVYLYHRDTKNLETLYCPRPDLQAISHLLSPMNPIRYPSSDGLDIPAYISFPKSGPSAQTPLVVLVHGGPKGPRDYWGYHPEVQFLTNRGYAVLQPNFRASGGYGKSFLNAGDKEWGRKMQDDITEGVRYAIHKEWVDPNRVAIMGGSYGGYATLAGLCFTPDLYRCGIDIVGPSNLFTLLESIPEYWEAGRKWLYEMVGDPDTEEGKQLLHERSPLFHVDKIEAPLLIIQGAHDPRVKKAESDQIVDALRSKGKPVMYILAEDEGHGFAKPINKMAMYTAVEDFLAEHLAGQREEQIPSEILDHLDVLIQSNCI